MKPWNNESLNNLLSKYSDFEGVLHWSEESGNIKKKIKVQPEGQGAAPGMIVYGAKQKVLNILAEISGIVSTWSEYKKPYEGVGDIDKTEASVKKFDESEHQLWIETKSLVAELSQKELSEKFIKLRTDLGMWMIEANNPLEEKKIVGILQDIKGIDSWPVFKEWFFIAAISAKSPEIYFQMKNIYKVIVNLTKKWYHISCMDQIFWNSWKFFENQAYVDSLLKNLKLLENYHPSPSIRKIIMEEIFLLKELKEIPLHNPYLQEYHDV